MLLDGDPLQDLSVLRRPVGVMVNGHWYDRAQLGDLLKARREATANSALR